MSLRYLGILFIKLIMLLLFCVMGGWLGFVLCNAWIQLEYTGRFTRWQLLESQQKFRHMIAVTRYDIWAQAENRSDYVYQFENCDGATCNEWIESTPASNFDPFMQSLISSGCESTYRYYAKDFNPA